MEHDKKRAARFADFTAPRKVEHAVSVEDLQKKKTENTDKTNDDGGDQK